MADRSDSPATASREDGIARGSRVYRRVNLALFAAGFATFSSLYCVQPLMPLFSHGFGVGPAQSSLSLSISTAVLAFTLFFAGLISQAVDRKRVMAASLLASALLAIVAAASPGWAWLLAVRALEGFALGGVPALAMAYLAEEIRAGDLGFAMGLYIGGSAFGGMSGRVLGGLVAQAAGWRAALATIGAIGLVAAGVFIALLPASHHFRPRRGLTLRDHLAPIADHLRHPALPWLFVCAFVLMGSFVSAYNYIGYRLARPPFDLGQAAIGAIFVVYLLGIASSTTFGRLSDRFGRAPMLVAGFTLALLGLACMWPDDIAAVVVGIALLTVGFFAAHSVASGWVGPLAGDAKGQAAGLYLLSYYLGSSLIGWLGGLFWSALGWPGVTLMIGLLLGAGLIASFWLASSRRGGPAGTGTIR